MHRILLSTFIIDIPTATFQPTLAFWGDALGADVMHTGHEQYHLLAGASSDFRVVAQDVQNSPAGVHFDIHTDDLTAEINRLLGLGATVVNAEFADTAGQYVIMADPSGKQFCVVYALNELRPQADRDAFQQKARTIVD